MHSQARPTSESPNLLLFHIFSDTLVAIQVRQPLKLSGGLCSEEQDPGGMSTVEFLIKQ